MNSNLPPGAEYDPRAPYNEPLKKSYRVEVGAEIGTMVKVECYEENLLEETKSAVINKLGIDGEDLVLNNLEIYEYQ